MPVVMHVVLPVDAAPAFVHVLASQDGRALFCVTVRGERHCTCGAYQLCDPLVGPCHEACGCQCHEAEGVYSG